MAVLLKQQQKLWNTLQTLCSSPWGNLTLARRDAYLIHLKNGVKPDTLAALRTAPLQIATLFPDSVIKKAEEEIAYYDSKGNLLHIRVVKVGTTLMREWKRNQRVGRTGSRKDLPGRILGGANSGEAEESLQTSLPDQPRASSRINDNYCVTKLQARLLAGSSPKKTLTVQSLQRHVKFPVANLVPSATGPPQRKGISPGLSDVIQKDCALKYVKGVSSVTQLSCVKPVTNVKLAVSNLPVGARLQNFRQAWLDLCAGPKVVQILKEGYTLPFQIRPNLTRSPTVISCYVNPHRNCYLLEALHQLMWVFHHTTKAPD